MSHQNQKQPVRSKENHIAVGGFYLDFKDNVVLNYVVITFLGPDAPIHSLPEGALPPGRPDNNSLAPSRKVNGAVWSE